MSQLLANTVRLVRDEGMEAGRFACSPQENARCAVRLPVREPTKRTPQVTNCKRALGLDGEACSPRQHGARRLFRLKRTEPSICWTRWPISVLPAVGTAICYD